MSDNEANTTANGENENVCVVCFKVAEIYSVGVCDHPVCYECSTRMRVLCRQNECPICRQDMPKVIFTKIIEPYSTLIPKYERTNLQDRRRGVLFCSSDIKEAYDRLLEHRCQICKNKERSWPHKTFQQLSDHMKRDHGLFYCEICVENLRIFSSERRCYTRQELALHRRKGDADNTSHRGHPLCEFCDVRYMDSDELFRHLRRTHLYCHFCDADGKHQYYNDIDSLVRHFKDEHYLCEEGDCKNMPLTAVFRTDIDLKAHIASEHSRNMSRSATKQARTLELEFTLAPRARNENRNKRFMGGRGEQSDEDNVYNMDPGGPGGGGESNNRVFVNPLTPSDFPALGGTDTNIVLQRPITTVNFTSKVNSTFSRKDFPSLGGSRYTPNSEVTITASQLRGQPQGSSKSNEDFPALGGANSGSGPSSSTVRLSVNSPDNAAKVSIQVNHRPNGGITTHITTSASTSTQQRTVEAFPALGGSTKVAQPQWVKAKSKKPEVPKASKVAPPPNLPPSSLDQFPSLSKKGTAVSAPVASNWVNLNNINKHNEYSNVKQSNKVSTTTTDNNNKKNEPKISKSKQVVESSGKNQDFNKVFDSFESKNKSKKKKAKSSNDGDSGKVSEVVNVETTNDKKSNSKLENVLKEPKTETSNNNLVNGLVKNASEMALSSDEFPVLSKTKPPPGFTVKPPPGFTPTSFPSVGGNDLTFTTSRGQSYSIAPSNSYHQPNNFQSRNQNLIKRLMSILNNNDSIKEFKTYSDLFRNGGYPTANYYDHCKSVLGDSFDEVFPELLVLLPDIQKQQELYGFYDGKGKKNIVPCEHCKQIIYKKELSEHYNYHVLENQFPTLGKVYQVENNAWKKR